MITFFKRLLRQSILVAAVIIGVAGVMVRYNDKLIPPPKKAVSLERLLAQKVMILINTTGKPTNYPREVMWDTRQEATQWIALDRLLKEIRPDDTIAVWSARRTERDQHVLDLLDRAGVQHTVIAQ